MKTDAAAGHTAAPLQPAASHLAASAISKRGGLLTNEEGTIGEVDEQTA